MGYIVNTSFQEEQAAGPGAAGRGPAHHATSEGTRASQKVPFTADGG